MIRCLFLPSDTSLLFFTFLYSDGHSLPRGQVRSWTLLASQARDGFRTQGWMVRLMRLGSGPRRCEKQKHRRRALNADELESCTLVLCSPPDPHTANPSARIDSRLQQRNLGQISPTLLKAQPTANSLLSSAGPYLCSAFLET